MIRVQPPCAARYSWLWLSEDPRHDSRRSCGRRRHRHNLLRSNLSLFSCHSRPDLIYLFFKGLFPAEIDQPTDNKDFD
jgi:hypothetical protein